MSRGREEDRQERRVEVRRISSVEAIRRTSLEGGVSMTEVRTKQHFIALTFMVRLKTKH